MTCTRLAWLSVLALLVPLTGARPQQGQAQPQSKPGSQPVQGTFGRITGLSAPHAEYLLESGTGHFWGGPGQPVVVTTTNGRITAMDVVGQYGRVNPTDARPTIIKVDASGGVTVEGEYVGTDKVRRVINATSERANYNVADRTLVLAGNVKGTVVEPDRRRTIDLDAERAAIDLEKNVIHLSQLKLVFTEEEPPAPAPAPPAAPSTPPAAAP